MILVCINDKGFPDHSNFPFGHPVKGNLYNAVTRCETPQPGFELEEFPRYIKPSSHATQKQITQYWAAWRFKPFNPDDVDISDLQILKSRETFIS